MLIKEYLKEKKIKQVEIASSIDIAVSTLNLYINGWQSLPTKYVKPFAEFVGLSNKEVVQGKTLTKKKLNLEKK